MRENVVYFIFNALYLWDFYIFPLLILKIKVLKKETKILVLEKKSIVNVTLLVCIVNYAFMCVRVCNNVYIIYNANWFCKVTETKKMFLPRFLTEEGENSMDH